MCSRETCYKNWWMLINCGSWGLRTSTLWCFVCILLLPLQALGNAVTAHPHYIKDHSSSLICFSCFESLFTYYVFNFTFQTCIHKLSLPSSLCLFSANNSASFLPLCWQIVYLDFIIALLESEHKFLFSTTGKFTWKE